jgi:integrase
MEKYSLSKRGNIWYIYYYENGVHKCKSTGKKLKTEALAYLTEFKNNQKKKSKLFLANAIELFLKHSKVNNSYVHYRDYVVKLNRFLKFIGNIEITKITTYQIQEYINSIISKSLANKSLTLIKSFFNFAVNQDLIQVNPCNRIKKFKLPEKQPLYFNESELLLVISHIKNNDLKDIVIWAVNTGMRLSEIVNLKWSQIDLENKTIILDNQHTVTKSKKVRSIPLNSVATSILLKRNKISDYVFTMNGNKFKINYVTVNFKRAVRKSGVNPLLHFHSLRHTFASNLVKNNVPIFAVSKLLGHSDIKTTLIYSHLQANDLKKEVETLTGFNYGVN